MGITELAFTLQCLHALGVTWRSITADATAGGGSAGGLRVEALREHMIRVYRTALLDTNSDDGSDKDNVKGLGNDKSNDDGSFFVMGESREARSLRQAWVAIGTTLILINTITISADNNKCRTKSSLRIHLSY